MNRRSVLTSAAILAVASGSAGSAQSPAAPVVRVSLGRYPPEKAEQIAKIMDYSGKPLETAIRSLPGLISYFSGIDRNTHAIVNASIWKDTESATQMESLQSMIDQGKALVALGVNFERPIPNFTTLWRYETP